MPLRAQETTIAEVQQAILAGELTARQLVDAYLERIAALDSAGPRLNSVITIASDAGAEADRLDAEFAATGTLSGPLHGVPIVVKDQVETAGLRTTFGSRTAADNIPDQDATVIAKLREAGAIVLAKTTMPDFATSWFSTSSVSGLTKNPYALNHDPGGSSSGTAAAVAANLALVGIGEDTGGSIRLPASFCNLVGLRVTTGLISRHGTSPLVDPQDTAGPMTRTVADAALLLDTLVGFDSADPYTSVNAIVGPPKSYLSALGDGSLEGRRIGVLNQAFGSDDDPECAAVNTVVRSALKKAADAGAELVDVRIEDLDRLTGYTSVYFTRSRQDIDAFIADRPGIEADSIAQIHQDKLYHDKLDLLEGIAQGPQVATGDPEYAGRLEARAEFQRAVATLMAERGLDAIAFPDVKVAAPTHADVEAHRWTCLTFPTNTVIASQLLFPALSLPAGFTQEGLPVGLELMGLPHNEATLLALGHGVEKVTGARRAPELG